MFCSFSSSFLLAMSLFVLKYTVNWHSQSIFSSSSSSFLFPFSLAYKIFFSSWSTLLFWKSWNFKTFVHGQLYRPIDVCMCSIRICLPSGNLMRYYLRSQNSININVAIHLLCFLRATQNEKWKKNYKMIVFASLFTYSFGLLLHSTQVACCLCRFIFDTVFERKRKN